MTIIALFPPRSFPAKKRLNTSHTIRLTSKMIKFDKNNAFSRLKFELHFFFYKNQVYKNVRLQIFKNLRTCLKHWKALFLRTWA